jgi:hypothetical protein
MREGEALSNIQSFQSLLEQLSTIDAPVIEDAILCFMRSMPFSHRTFITSMWRQPNITLQSLITNLQKEVLMKFVTHTTDSMSALYVGKRPYYPKGRIQRVGPRFLQ